MALGGEKGQNSISMLEHSFIYHFLAHEKVTILVLEDFQKNYFWKIVKIWKGYRFIPQGFENSNSFWGNHKFCFRKILFCNKNEFFSRYSERMPNFLRFWRRFRFCFEIGWKRHHWRASNFLLDLQQYSSVLNILLLFQWNLFYLDF